ncbi:MAG: hypothetical protein RBS36_07365 [Thiomicrospira sp.]|jgi:hypothetical protein|nr:hypothetical protein [Thiomicrospira sp.]
MNFLEKPLDQYKRFNAYIHKDKTKLVRCFLWLPKSFEQEEPHVFLYVGTRAELKSLEAYLALKDQRGLNLTVPIGSFNKTDNIGCHLFKRLYFSHSSFVMHAENWEEGFFKFFRPARAMSQFSVDTCEQELNAEVTFFHTPSELLKSDVIVTKHYTGEVRRSNAHGITVNGLEHLGLTYLTTDKWTGDSDTYVLKLQPFKPINSVFSFGKRVKPVADFIFAVTSFIERNKINWHMAAYSTVGKYNEIYNTLSVLKSSKQDFPLLEAFEFKDVFTVILHSTTLQDMDYKAKLCLAYVSGLEYSVNAKIVLWNSLLEKILKHNGLIKKDAQKADGIKKLGVITSDLPAIKDLVDLRNAIAHSDDVHNDALFKLAQDWELLIERVILAELGFRDFNRTHLRLRSE